jgi:hypothetical protein
MIMTSPGSITSQRSIAEAKGLALAWLVTPAVAQITKALLISAWLCIGAASAFAQSLVFVKNVNVGGNGLEEFDISFDSSGLYILADRTNASIDLLGSDMGHFQRPNRLSVSGRRSRATAVLRPAYEQTDRKPADLNKLAGSWEPEISPRSPAAFASGEGTPAKLNT